MKPFIKIIIIFSIIICMILSFVYWAFFDIQHIKGQEYLTESTSPNGKYTVTAYLNNGGATTAYAVLCRLKNNENGKTKNIYWQYRCEEAVIEWTEDNNVIINGIKLDPKIDIYDYRQND